ncbi:hypothetical protein [Phyllobacterium sp. SB3]|uniref:hypothetical protein n=1 Tax=Phyllobacterium sp. SB3 TaxID=3156073 RepID=UPI0032AF73C7
MDAALKPALEFQTIDDWLVALNMSPRHSIDNNQMVLNVCELSSQMDADTATAPLSIEETPL